MQQLTFPSLENSTAPTYVGVVAPEKVPTTTSKRHFGSFPQTLDFISKI
jgi:hypothetical protein